MAVLLIPGKRIFLYILCIFSILVILSLYSTEFSLNKIKYTFRSKVTADNDGKSSNYFLSTSPRQEILPRPVRESSPFAEHFKCKKKINPYSPKSLNENYDQKVIRRHPNLPNFLLNSSSLMNLIPPVYNIRWHGHSFQESWENNPKCYLFSANFDARLPTGPVVRILGLCQVKNQTLDFFCQFWDDVNENPVISHVYESDFPENIGKAVEWKTTMMLCKVPVKLGLKIPIAVSLVKNPCTTPTNIMKIGGSMYWKDKTENKNMTIGLCGKSIFYYNYDYSIRLIEWIEILKLLGISRFFLYKTLCHKNVEKVLDYYEEEGTVKIISFHYPNPYVQEGTFLRLWTTTHYNHYNSAQKTFYNDCIWRNKDDFDYLAIFDYDEIPILKTHRNLFDFIKYVKTSVKGADKAAAYSLMWKHHFGDPGPSGPAVNVSEDLYNIRHNVRTPVNVKLKKELVPKSIYDTSKTLYVDIHIPIKFKAVKPFTSKYVTLSKNIAYTGHFKNLTCDSECRKEGLEEENRLLEYEDEVQRRMDFIRAKIGLI